MRNLLLCIAFSLPVWLFDPTGTISFRTFQWGALFLAALGISAANFRSLRMNPWLLLGLVPPLLSLLWYPNGEGLVAFAAWGAFAILVSFAAGSPNLGRAAMFGLLVGAGLNLAMLCLQAAGFDPMFSIPEEVIKARVKGFGTAGLTGFVGNASDLAIFFLLCLPVADELFQSRRGARIASLGALTAGILLTGSRLPLLLAFGFLFVRMPGKLRWGVPVVLLVVVLLYPPLRYKTLGAFERGLVSQQLDRRLTEWSVAKDVFLESPWFPQGIGNYGILEADRRFEASLPVGDYHGWFVQAHNEFLQAAVEVGILGLFFYALALVPFATAIRNRRVEPWSLLLFVPLLFFHFPARLAPAVYALTAGIRLPLPEWRPRLERSSSMIALAAVLIGVLVVGLDWAAANRVFKPSEQFAGFLPEARVALAVREGRAFSKAGQPADADRAWRQVLEIQPNPMAAMNHARYLNSQGDPGAAATAICRSYVVTGHSTLARWLYVNRDHVKNFAARDKRLLPCILERLP